MNSEGALAFALAEAAATAGAKGLLYVGGDPELIARLAAAARGFAPDVCVLELPPWDTLPYDRALPSRAVTGRRVASLAALAAGHSGPHLVLTTPESLVQRVPPRDRLREREVSLAVGASLDPDWLRDTLLGFGYRFEDVVDEPGEAAIRGAVIDIYPADAPAPLRLDLDNDRLAELHAFDRLTQRSLSKQDGLRLRPASEGFSVPGEALPGRSEALLPQGELETLFDYLPDAAMALSPEAEERIQDWLDLVCDSYAVRHATLAENEPVPPAPEHLYLAEQELASQVAARSRLTLTLPAEPPDIVQPLTSTSATAIVRARMAAGDAVLVCAGAAADAWHARLRRRLGEVARLPDWPAAIECPPGSITVLPLPLSEGFLLPGRSILAVEAGRAGRRSDASAAEALIPELRIGDLVVQPEHGLARLTDLAPLGEPQETECLTLAFAKEDRLLVPAPQAGTVWRYGADAVLQPDRLQGAGWVSRRQHVEAEIDQAAREILRRAREREGARAPAIEPGLDYPRFVRRVPYRLTPGQRRAIEQTLADLAKPQPMHRLVCGDVGFGKTEVALHAAAAAALAGYQVAVIAPTTLLASQHLESFRRRLQPFGLHIEPLIRSSRSADTQAILHGLANGSIHIVVGTHAIATRSLRFARLGLVVIDEEQHFGQAHKRALQRLQGGMNTLVMTATPLPRSLQATLVGLVDVSLLTEPPAAREPVRTFTVPFEAAVVRAALMRESRRGGQSFVVCPHIEDIGPMQARLHELVPELSLHAVHGRMAGPALDKAMLDFAAGRFDVLLATNIIEAGLDLPNANTMLVWRADRFGLAQLHQLRGRVGRGRTRAVAYLLTDPDRKLPTTARKRLEKLAALQDRGAGFAISAADLDIRGAGDLLGDQQAGHLRLLGTELYRHLMVQALRRACGKPVVENWLPELSLELPAYVPTDFIPEADLRLDVYRRLATLKDVRALDDATEELADRFGDLPPAFAALLEVTRLRLLCRAAKVREVKAGPRGVALYPRDAARAGLPAGEWNGERVLLPIAEPDPMRRLARINAALSGAIAHAA